MTKIAASVLAILSAFGIAQAQAAAPSGIVRDGGTLTCHVDPGVGLVLGSVRRVDCKHTFFDRRGRQFVEDYTGTMRRAGFDVGVSSEQVVTWSVVTHHRRGRFDMLSGVFGGSSADASLIVGAGTQALVGQTARDVVLEPMSGSGQVGIGLGFGATSLELQRIPGSAYTSFRY